MTTYLAGVDVGSTPVTPVLVGSVAIMLAAVFVGVTLRRVPGVALLSAALFVAGTFPLAWHAPEWFGISYASAPALEWPVVLLEVLVAALIVGSVFQIRAQQRQPVELPENEETYA